MTHPWEQEAAQIVTCATCEDDPDAPSVCPGHDEDGQDGDSGHKGDE